VPPAATTSITDTIDDTTVSLTTTGVCAALVSDAV